MEEKGINISLFSEKVNQLRAEAQGVIFIAIDAKAAGFISVADPIKESTLEAIRLLHSEGIKIVMLTGDNLQTAQAVAKKVGIDEVQAEVLPADKEKHIAKLQEQGRKVAMAGDGINDAPALTLADLGIAVGGGTDIAMESGNIVLMNSDPMKVISAINLSKKTFRVIKENLFFAFIYNVIAIPLAALGLLSPMIAAAAMSFSSVSVVVNSLRIRRAKI